MHCGGCHAAGAVPARPYSTPPRPLPSSDQERARLVQSMTAQATEALQAGRMAEHQLYCDQIIAIKQEEQAAAALAGPVSAKQVTLHVRALACPFCCSSARCATVCHFRLAPTFGSHCWFAVLGEPCFFERSTCSVKTIHTR